MRLPGNRTLRMISMTAVILITVSFCIALYLTGRLKFEAIESAAADSGMSLSLINKCTSSLDELLYAANCAYAGKINASELEDKARIFRRSAGELALFTSKHSGSPGLNDGDIVMELAQAMHETALRPVTENEKSGNSLKKAAETIRDGIPSALGKLSKMRERTQNGVIENYRSGLHVFYDGLSWLLVLLVLSVCAGIVAAMLTDRPLKNSLKRLRDGTRILKDGDLSYRFKDIGSDETGELMYAFNLMASRLESQEAGLRSGYDRLKRQAEELISAHQHKDRFLANMSHELRTPLNSVIGFAELIDARAGKLPPEKLHDYSGKIVSAAEHLLSLIVSLLDLAKSGAGVLKPVFAETDVSLCAGESAELIRPLAGKKGLELRLDVEPGVILSADGRMIRQILINLLGNAVKFTREGYILLKVERKDGKCVCSVSDTGSGIPDSEQKNIFRDFYRVESDPEHPVEGVGIGLALSRRLAVLHGGGISFTSSFGKGSVFTLSIPLENKNTDSKTNTTGEKTK